VPLLPTPAAFRYDEHRRLGRSGKCICEEESIGTESYRNFIIYGVSMVEPVVLRSLFDMTLANAQRVAFDRAPIVVSEEARRVVTHGRLRFEQYLLRVGGTIYGSTTAAGARARGELSQEDAKQRAQSIRSYGAVMAGLGGDTIPERCMRLVVLARLTNSMTGRGKLRPETVQSIAEMALEPPPVPLRTSAGSGEVIPLTWLAAPLADFPLQIGEPMGLVNGSPFATAMVCDVALTLRRRLQIAEMIFALSIEASACPATHFDPRLGDYWPDPYYQKALRRLSELLADSRRKQLTHQAPTSWRVLPNVLASAMQALDECSTAADISLRALKDNPTFLFDDVEGRADTVVSSGGYHDHRSAKAIDQANSVMFDMTVLASRQIGRFLDGEGLGLPPLLGCLGERAGMEYVAWGLTGPLASARRAAEPTNLDLSLHDPVGNQSDIASLAIVAYGKHLDAALAWDDSLATLATISILALDFRNSPLPRALACFCEPLLNIVHAARDRTDAGGEALRSIRELLRQWAEDWPTEQFSGLFPMSGGGGAS
jgi:histidine ammonia-lyase